VKVDATYTTPAEEHCAMELHSTVARWDGDTLTLDDSTQWVYGQPKSLAHVLGLPQEKVIVRAPFIGGGFGSKLFLWPHCVLAAVAARELRRPVKFVLPRQLHFTTAGHRPVTRQRLRLAAERGGRLVSIRHDSESHTSLVTEFVESCGEATPSLYECANVSTSHRLIAINVGTPTSMRAPGACPGTFALESAMDELALALDLDPAELRLKNVPTQDGDKKLPWSSNHFADCIRMACERFGWAKRRREVGAMREGRDILGWGFAAATWPALRQQASARVELRPNGTARVACGTQDIGTGTYTVLAQVVAELTGLPFDKIEVAIGDSTLPRGPISGGSMATATVVPAIAQATQRALRAWQAQYSRPFPDTAGAAGSVVTGEAETKPGDEAKQFSFRSFGAHCVEVRWDPGLSRLRVSRVVTVCDTGRVINRKTAANQIEGALVMGLGMALLEESVYDRRTGRPVTDNLADYHVPVHADLPQLDVTLLDRPDSHIGDFGAKGLGELGITGIAAAIANAVYHATGKRVRDLPITIEKLL
jgi:xanthine dehydrogenase YagR molybdenum-binding subunit